MFHRQVNIAIHIKIVVLLLACDIYEMGDKEKDPRCIILPRAGTCDTKHNKTWYYSLFRDWCKEFEKGKCARNENGFDSCNECNRACKTPVCVKKLYDSWLWFY
uniref:Putative bovine pancreatic trypsin inhibitor n=1 Tax=Rhipicephalus microplus TaxID=6941 RepID=A0A6G5A951_RHIMP